MIAPKGKSPRLRAVLPAMVAAALVLLGLTTPARAASWTITGTVTSSQGQVSGGFIEFYASCDAYGAAQSASWGSFDGGRFELLVPAGTYRVLLQPDPDSGGIYSWHSAKPTCEEADEVTVAGPTTVQLMATPESGVEGTVSTSKGPVEEGAVTFYGSCAAFQEEEDSGYADFTGGRYRVALPNDTYRVLITQQTATGEESLSWHRAKSDCDQADLITVNGDTTADLVALPAGGGSGHTVPGDRDPIGGKQQALRQPPAAVKLGHHRKLAKATDRGARVAWKSTKKRVCKVKGAKVTGMRKGTCKLRATAPAVAGYASYRHVFTITVKRGH